MNYLIVVLAVIFGIFWWFKQRANYGTVSASTSDDKNVVSDNELTQLQTNFERRILEEQDLPDGIRGKQAYIYWNLMRNWFAQLNATYRYDAKALQLRLDWCDYIDLIHRTSTSRYLALESDNEDKAAVYYEEVKLSSQRIEFIENAYAAAIGVEATEELHKVKNRETGAFDRSGTQPIAPIGHHYFQVSLNPYVEKCQPILADPSLLKTNSSR
jgi:hypothetical protein